MKKQIIQEQLKNSPKIAYYFETNKLEIVGRLIPENPEPIFKRIEDWIKLHLKKNDALNILIQLEYLNSSSSEYLFGILTLLTFYKNGGKDIEITWQYEEDDESMFELGEYYRDYVGVPLKIESVL